MHLRFLGAAQTVTGSQHLLELNGTSVLLECGLYQGRRAEGYRRNRTFLFNPRTLHAVLLSHAHIDHAGNLPNLVRQGYPGPIYATPASADLADIMLRDSGHIQEADAEYLNRKHPNRQPPAEPLYTLADAERVAAHFRSVEYGQPFEAAPGLTAQFLEAGHILGSAALRLELKEKGRTVRLWFSGDIGRFGLPLLRDPLLPEAVDYLLMECTYGDRSHADPRRAYEEFHQVVSRTIARGGKVIVPAFAVGRTQELVYYLNEMVHNNELPPVPVFVDSPLAVSASEVFKRHPECYDEETRLFVQQNHHPALDFEHLTYVRTVEESKALNARREPMIIISASGMAETGRILHHLKNNIGDPRNTILIVSWQAPETLGRRLAEREKRVRIFGEPYEVRAEIATIGGLSAHADQNLLARYALTLRGRVKKVFLVHGDPRPAAALTETLKQHGLSEVYYPELYSGVEL